MIKKDSWKQITEIDTQYSDYTLKEFLDLIKQYIPTDTSPEDIKLSFEAEIDTTDYYDQQFVVARMELLVREK